MSVATLFPDDDPLDQAGNIHAPAHWQDSEQIENAERVAGAIGRDVMRFYLTHRGKRFRMEALRASIGSGRAPDSAGRILRLLRQKGLLDYEVVNRAQSLYRFPA